jgi:hypothetical protein
VIDSNLGIHGRVCSGRSRARLTWDEERRLCETQEYFSCATMTSGARVGQPLCYNRNDTDCEEHSTDSDPREDGWTGEPLLVASPSTELLGDHFVSIVAREY